MTKHEQTLLDPLWQPSESQIEQAQMTAFMRFVEQHSDQVSFDGSYERLHAWSVSHKEDFWQLLWRFFDVIGNAGEKVLVDGDKMPGAQWFPDATLNFAENLLRYRDDRVAIVFNGENGDRNEVTYAELYQQVAALASRLKGLGMVAGDRVAGMLPNCIETIVAMLATTSLGAVWSSCSPDFGVQGVLDRFGQIEPKVLFTVNGYYYNGKTIDIGDKVAAIHAQLPTVETLVVVPFASRSASNQIANATLWADYCDNTATNITFVPRQFNDPLYIMFSSGTTGVPKCIVHGIGGTLLQHLKEHALHTDLRRDDTLFYFTTCGWMMWNWLVSGLAVGSTVVLYDGSPFHPSGKVLWDLADEVGISVLGTSAKWIAACDKVGLKPRESHRLESLRAILSTGSPLLPESFDYVYRDV